MNSVGTIVAILAGAVIVIGGIVALVRAIWKVAQTMRDNTVAVRVLTERLQEYTQAADSRYENLDGRVAALERKGLGRGNQTS